MTNRNADIRVLIGVAKGGADGDSADLIKQELKEILSKINKEPLKVKITFSAGGDGNKPLYEQLQNKLDALSERKRNQLSVKVSKIDISQSALADFKRQLSSVLSNISSNSGLEPTGSTGQKNSSKNGKTGSSESDSKDTNNLKMPAKEYNAYTVSAHNLLQQITAAQRSWSRAGELGSPLKYRYDELNDYRKKIEDFYSTLSSKTPDEAKGTLSGIKKEFKETGAAIKSAGEDAKSLIPKLSGLSSKFASWLTVSQLIMMGTLSIRNMIIAVQELDSALTQISIVTGITGKALKEFAIDAASVAKSIGSSITDVIGSTETFARLGYNLEDALKLAEVTGKYSNVAAVSISEATTSMTSIMKAFNYSASDMEEVVDMLVKVGQEYAVSASELGVALQNGGSAMQAGGNSLQEAIALIAAGNAAVQDAGVVGNALKTTSMRIRSSTAELEEMGETVDELVKSASSYRKEIMALSGVDIMLDANTYKSTYQILKEIASVWDKMTDIQQASLLEDLAGKRNANVVKSIITNLNDLIGAYDAANNAAGTLAEANDKYMESIQAKLGQFSAQFQELSSSAFNSDLIKTVVDIGTGLLSIATGLAKINMLLPTIVAAIVSIKTYTAWQKIEKDMASLSVQIIAQKSNLDELSKTYASLSVLQQKKVLENLSEAVSEGKLTEAEYREIAAKLQKIEITEVEIATTETEIALHKQLASGIKAIWASNPVGWIILGISLLPTLCGLLGSVHKSNKDLINDAKELRDNYKNAMSETTRDLDTLRGLQEEFNKLSYGVDDYGNNISLAADDYKRYRDIVETILGISPELIAGYDAEGKAIANKNGLLKDSIRLMEQEQRLKVKEYLSDESLKTLSKGAAAELKEPRNSVTDTTNLIGNVRTHKYIKDNIDTEISGNLGDYIVKNYQLVNASLDNMQRIIRNDILNDLGEKRAREYDEYIEKHIKPLIQKTQDLNSQIHNVLKQAPQMVEGYYELGNAQKSVISQYVESLKVSADMPDDALEKMRDDISSLTESLVNNDKLQATVTLGIALKDGKNADGKELTVSEYKELLEEFLNQIDNYDKDIQIKIKAAFDIDENNNIGFESEVKKAKEHLRNILQESVEEADFSKMLESLTVKDLLLTYKISADPHSLTIDEVMEKIELLGVNWQVAIDVWDFSKTIDGLNNVEKGVKDLVTAMTSLKDGTALTSGELSQLALKYPELLKASDLFQTGTVEGQQKMLDAILETYEAEYDGLIDAKIAELEATNLLIEKQVDLENTKKNKVVEIQDLQSNGKLDSEEDYQKKLNELRDLEGQNFVVYGDGVLKANEDMLEKQLEQMSDNVKKSAPIFEAQGDLIAEANAQGLNKGLAAFPEYLNKLKVWAGTAFKDLVSKIGINIKSAFSGGEFIDIPGNDAKSNKVAPIKIDVPVSLNGLIDKAEYDTTIDGKSVGDWSASYQEHIKQRVEILTEQISINNTIIDNLQKLKHLDLKQIYGSNKNSTKKQIDEYIADIDEYYKALKRLESINLRLSELQNKIESSQTDKEKIVLTKQLISVYADEADALENLNHLRQQTITNSITELENLGFKVKYNAATNEFLVNNLEHLNELQAKSKGKYDTLQEATNALREETEKLINTMNDLNSANQDGIESMRKLKADIQSSKEAVIDYLNNIVELSHNAVDEFQNVYDILHSAADDYASTGYVMLDTLQSIMKLGTQYMQYLTDENGLLVIEHDRINQVIAAKTQELAVNQAMNYVERLRLATEENSIENLNELLYATTETSDSTWGLVYAELALLQTENKLNNNQYQAALHNINSIRVLADSAVNGIGHTANEVSNSLSNMKSGLDDILKYVMDMLKQRIQSQIDALEDLKTSYSELIDLRKKSLDSTKKEADYQNEVAKKTKEIAKLQVRINALSLDTSRDSQAQRVKLEEEMYELQESLSDKQADYARDAQKDALDDMQKAYEKEKDSEIKVLENSISSYQKLYDKAIDYISSNWNSLYLELIDWNNEYGSVLDSEITSAWERALEAAQRYGDYVSALNNIDADISSANGDTHNDIINKASYNTSFSAEDGVHSIIKEMYANSQAWKTANATRQKQLDEANLELGKRLRTEYNINAVRNNGVWYVGNPVADGTGELLFEKYKHYLYHSGGIAGDISSLKQNEVLAKLEKGEMILDTKKEQGLYKLIDFTTVIAEKFNKVISSVVADNLLGGYKSSFSADAFTKLNTSSSPSVQFGNVYIYGSNSETVEKHREINRQFTNDVLKLLNIKR